LGEKRTPYPFRIEGLGERSYCLVAVLTATSADLTSGNFFVPSVFHFDTVSASLYTLSTSLNGTP